MTQAQLLKILLVDDDKSLMEALAGTLRATLSAIVFTAASVPAAVTEIDDHGPFDVIVSDYQMPPHTARDLADHMKRGSNRTPFIVHSGFDEIDESQFSDTNYFGLASKAEPRALTKLLLQHFPQARKT